MPFHLDHAVVAVGDLAAAMQDYRRLGFTVVPGGVHANRATHNALITFANGTYLELLAATGQPPLLGLIDFSRLLCSAEGLVGFALRSPDLEADAARLRSAGVAVGPIIPGERRRADGTLVQWKLALLADGFAPFFIQDVTPQERRITRDPAITTHANSALGLCGVGIEVSDLSGAGEQYARLFGLPPQIVPGVLAVGEVVLRAAAAGDGADVLVSLDLAVEDPGEQPFPLMLAHGVRFHPVLVQS